MVVGAGKYNRHRKCRFRKSPCGGTNAENQSRKVQENPREHSVVANHEDIPTGDRSGIYPLPKPRPVSGDVALDLKEEMNSLLLIQERFCKHQSLIKLFHACVHDCAVEAAKIAMLSSETEEDRSVHYKYIWKRIGSPLRLQ